MVAAFSGELFLTNRPQLTRLPEAPGLTASSWSGSCSLNKVVNADLHEAETTTVLFVVTSEYPAQVQNTGGPRSMVVE